jgi:hypothetical protein
MYVFMRRNIMIIVFRMEDETRPWPNVWGEPVISVMVAGWFFKKTG